MYQYYKGLIIREGAEGLKGDTIKKMYKEVGWGPKIDSGHID